MADLATQRDDRKAAVRALELLGRHLEPGFFGDNKPQPAEPRDLKQLAAEIALVTAEITRVALERRDPQLLRLLQLSAVPGAVVTEVLAEPESSAPQETTALQHEAKS